MPDISTSISAAYFPKEQRYAILSEPDPDQQRKLFRIGLKKWKRMRFNC